jgi:hypothetical protein
MARSILLTIFAFIFFSCTVLAPINTDDDDDNDDTDTTAIDDDDDNDDDGYPTPGTNDDDDDTTAIIDDDDDAECIDCGSVTYTGECDGTILSWCDNGCLKTPDCNEAGQFCGWVSSTTGYNCVDSCTARLEIYNWCADPIDLLDYDPASGTCTAAVATLNFSQYWYGDFPSDTPIAFCVCDSLGNCTNDYQNLVCGETTTYEVCGN